MRYTKIALLIFGLGVILGLVVVAGEYAAWERPAAAIMALGLVLMPVGLFADGRGIVLIHWLTRRLSRQRPPPKRPRRPGTRRKTAAGPTKRPPVRRPARNRRR